MAAIPTAKRIDANTLNLKENVVSINRVTKVVKGGKNLSFSALVVIGDPGAKIVGFGTGQFADFGDGFGEGFFEALQIVDEFGALARVEERAVVVALLARELAYLGYTHGNDGKGGIDGERFEIFGCEGGLSVGKAGEAQVGLVRSVTPHRLRESHARQRLG